MLIPSFLFGPVNYCSVFFLLAILLPTLSLDPPHLHPTDRGPPLPNLPLTVQLDPPHIARSLLSLQSLSLLLLCHTSGHCSTAIIRASLWEALPPVLVPLVERQTTLGEHTFQDPPPAYQILWFPHLLKYCTPVVSYFFHGAVATICNVRYDCFSKIWLGTYLLEPFTQPHYWSLRVSTLPTSLNLSTRLQVSSSYRQLDSRGIV